MKLFGLEIKPFCTCTNYNIEKSYNRLIDKFIYRVSYTRTYTWLKLSFKDYVKYRIDDSQGTSYYVQDFETYSEASRVLHLIVDGYLTNNQIETGKLEDSEIVYSYEEDTELLPQEEYQ